MRGITNYMPPIKLLFGKSIHEYFSPLANAFASPINEKTYAIQIFPCWDQSFCCSWKVDKIRPPAIFFIFNAVAAGKIFMDIFVNFCAVVTFSQ